VTKFDEVMGALDTLLAIPETSRLDFAEAMVSLCAADDFTLRRAQKHVARRSARTGDLLTKLKVDWIIMDGVPEFRANVLGQDNSG
jgi:hypothetical protein